ncbi:unnamed protein product [Schistosoma mattheei]|uniref:Uncharacterized protein n=1 Tax=Schistosoma mattheei TaxID=31246 RepID=A0A3P8KUU2_9TREM|nr:unnamed protein product [Schistosoma mattheei]
MRIVVGGSFFACLFEDLAPQIPNSIVSNIVHTHSRSDNNKFTCCTIHEDKQ